MGTGLLWAIGRDLLFHRGRWCSLLLLQRLGFAIEPCPLRHFD
jgi:hypothetical protein